jgi:hypothetical protein
VIIFLQTYFPFYRQLLVEIVSSCLVIPAFLLKLYKNIPVKSTCTAQNIRKSYKTTNNIKG